MKLITELKNIHKNNDIWILASGPSMNFIKKSFFQNKITLGVNRICKYFDCTYIVAKDSEGFDNILKNKNSQTKLILSKHHGGTPSQRLNTINTDHYIFPHPAKKNENPDLSVIKKDSNQIVVSHSTITSAIHLAAFMGAANIIICGHDCGTIDGYSTINGYYKDISPAQMTEDGYLHWLKNIESQSSLVSKAISKEYACNIYSLNPFLNLNATGHHYTHATKLVRFNPMIPWISFIKTSVFNLRILKAKIIKKIDELIFFINK